MTEQQQLCRKLLLFFLLLQYNAVTFCCVTPKQQIPNNKQNVEKSARLYFIKISLLVALITVLFDLKKFFGGSTFEYCFFGTIAHQSFDSYHYG